MTTDLRFRKNLISVADFVKTRDRLFCSGWAGPGEGKTYFCLGFPSPIYMYSFEPEGPLWALRTALHNGLIEPDDVYVDEVIPNALKTGDFPLIRDTEEEHKIYDYFKDAVDYVCRTETQGTIAIDTGTTFNQITQEVEMEEIVKKRKRQGKSEPYKFDFGHANRATKHFIDRLRASSMNLVIVHHAREKYNSKGDATGRFEYQGSGQIVRWVDVHGRIQYKVREGEEPDSWMDIEKCRLDRSKIGTEVENPSYETLMKALGN